MKFYRYHLYITMPLLFPTKSFGPLTQIESLSNDMKDLTNKYRDVWFKTNAKKTINILINFSSFINTIISYERESNPVKRLFRKKQLLDSLSKFEKVAIFRKPRNTNFNTKNDMKITRCFFEKIRELLK
jgi:hypothetical protein